jgi:hypothetical protein
MTDTKPKRRWFRFGLRTLFVLVTIVGLFAGWFAYQLNLGRQRRQFLNSNREALLAENLWHQETETHLASQLKPKPISWIRRVLGDPGTGFIMLPTKHDQHQVDQANALFPEARVFVWSELLTNPDGHGMRTTIEVTSQE